MKQWIKAVGTDAHDSRNLSYDEAAAAAHAIAGGESTDAQCAAFFMALKMKGETEEEMTAFIDVFRTYSLGYTAYPDSLNCAGPYDGLHYFPITLPVSLLLASVGFPQVLHGSDSFPPKLGTTMKELLEGLGVAIDLSSKTWESLFFRLHIGFLRTDRLCPPIGRLRQVREQLGLRTLLNTVENVINPLQSANMIIGVDQRNAMEHLIPFAMKSGFQNVYIVQGIDGSEDLPIHTNSMIRIVTPWGDESRMVEPQKFGFYSEPLVPISKEEQFILLKRIIAGDDSPELKKERDHIIFNAGLRLTWFDKVGSYEEGFQMANSLLQRKDALKVLTKWQEQSVKYKEADLEPRLKAN